MQKPEGTNLIEYGKEVSVFSCALAILQDHCPFHPQAYLCAQQEEYDEEICFRCWFNYLFAVANGKYEKK